MLLQWNKTSPFYNTDFFGFTNEWKNKKYIL